MPTGYTAKVADGEIVTLRQYALQCLRAFGVLIHMRDEPLSTSIPETISPNSYYTNHLNELSEEFDDFLSCSEEEQRDFYDRECARELAYYIQDKNRKEKQDKNYSKLLKESQEWEVPEEYSKIKEFMISQLKKSIKFDSYVPSEPKEISFEEWKENKIENFFKDFEYYSKKEQEEIDSNQEKNEFLAGFMKILPKE